MIKPTSSTLFAFIFLTLLYSCKDEECHNVDYGYLAYDPVSLTYETWDSVTTAIFIDSSGTEHPYDLSHALDYKSMSNQPDSCEGQLVFIAHSFQHYAHRFTSGNNTSIAYAQVVGFLDGEDSFEKGNIVDILKMSIYDDNNNPDFTGRICVITSDRGGSIDQGTYNAGQFIKHDSIVIFNKTFHNVYEQKEGTNKLYYSPDTGVVSFTDNAGTKLVLDRVE